MISKEVLTKIKEIEIQTRRLLSGMLVGDKTSAIKGSGFEFDQIREYTQGDDVRFIDWHSSARNNTLLVKQFMEERSRTIILAVDCSSSMFFSTTEALKYEVAAQIASILALVAGYGKDHVGLLLFSDEVEVVIQPKMGAAHIRTVMHQVLSQVDRGKNVNTSAVLDRLMQYKKHNAIIFLVSDFLIAFDEKKMHLLAKKHELIAVRCLDKYERIMPAVGMVHVIDVMQKNPLSLLFKRVKKTSDDILQQRLHEQNKLFRKYAIDVLDIEIDRPFIVELIRFFRKRMMY